MNVSIVSPYRKRDETITPDAETTALNFVTEALAFHLAQDGVAVRVLTQHLGTKSASRWHDGNVTVDEIPASASPFDFFQLAFAVPRADRIVHIEHELFAYGGIVSAFTVPPAIWLLRCRGHAVMTTLHGVIPLDKIDQAFVRSYRVWGPPFLIRAIWKLLIRGVCIASTLVHVHEDAFASSLRNQYGVRSPIAVVPLGIDLRVRRAEKTDARRALGIDPTSKVACFFGFLYKRKGIAELLHCARRLTDENPDVVVLVAGDLPRRAGDAREVEALIASLRDCERVVFTGFVSDDRVPDVLAAADVMILPYTLSISSSGPLTIALAYGLPVLLSNRFERYFPEAPELFEPTADGIRLAIEGYFFDADVRERVRSFSILQTQERRWQVVAKRMRALYESIAE